MQSTTDSTSEPAIASLIPHDGEMVLLDRVQRWDEEFIQCSASSHKNPNNPLSYNLTLPIVAGIEYAAQAMAAHGTLCEQGHTGQNGSASPRVGYLAVLSKVCWHVGHLHLIDSDLIVEAKKLAATGAGTQYQFSLSAKCKQLMSGEAIVAFEDVD